MKNWGFLGHHLQDKERVELDLMLFKISSFDTRYETTLTNYTFIDEDGRYFFITTPAKYNVTVGNHYRIQANIKHTIFKKTKQKLTKLSKPKFMKILYKIEN